MRYENFLNVFLILLSEIVITTKNMYRDKKTFEIGFICSLRFLDSLSRNTHEILD